MMLQNKFTLSWLSKNNVSPLNGTFENVLIVTGNKLAMSLWDDAFQCFKIVQ